jgi:site-specific recombinase XerD
MRRHWLLRLEEFLEEQQEPGLCGISLPALDRFIAGVAQCSSRSTTQWVVGVLRTLLRYLFLVGREREDRSPLLQSPRVYRRMKVPRHLTDEQLEEALLKVDRTTPRGKRDWAVLMLLCGYGLRAGEASRLRLKDVDFEGHRLFVRRLKGAGTRIFPLTSAVEGALREYLAEARPACSHPEVFLTCHPPFRPFPSGSSLSNSCVRQYIKHLTGLPSRGAHALRHTLARRMLQSGAPLEVVRRTLGHRDMNTTCGYLRISIEELREVADNYAELL